MNFIKTCLKTISNPLNLSLIISSLIPNSDNIPINSPPTNKFINVKSKDRYALIIGINYDKNTEERNSIEDAKNIRKTLIEKFKFSEKNIIFLVDDLETKNIYKPNFATIKTSLELLLNHANKDSFFFIYYSGLGFEKEDNIRADECWLPSDYTQSGNINMQYIATHFINHLDSRNNCIIISDTCHCNSIKPVNYCYNPFIKNWFKNNNLLTTDANVIILSTYVEGNKDNRISGLISHFIEKYMGMYNLEEFILRTNDDIKKMNSDQVVLMYSNNPNLGSYRL